MSPATPRTRPDAVRASTAPPLADAMAAGPVLLDGGLSNQLEAAGHDLSDALWCARLLADRPRALVEAHLAYLRAGARVVTTASYQASFEGFARRGLDARQSADLLRRSVALGHAAARRVAEDGDARARWVAASVGPYGAVLADGSEYRGRYGKTLAQLESFHGPRVEALTAAAPDVLAFETVPDLDEARALIGLVRGSGIACWLSYSVAGGRTRAGQPLDEAFAVAADVPEVIAVGVNCCAPEDVDLAVPLAAQVTGKPVVAYPNSGERWDDSARRWRGPARFDPRRVTAWVSGGARLIGGCCRIGPEDIKAIDAALHA